MPRYNSETAATDSMTYGPYTQPAGARFGWQSRARELWILAGLVAAGVGAGGLVVTGAPVIGLRWPAWVPAVGTAILAFPALEERARAWAQLSRDLPANDDGNRWPLWLPALGAVILTPPAIGSGWPWWLPPVAAVCFAGLAFAAASVYLVNDDRRLLWAIAPAQEEPQVTRIVDAPRFVYVNKNAPKGPALPPGHDLPELPSMEERKAQARTVRLWCFIRGAMATGDPSWETWQKATFPDGSKMGKDEWREHCELLLRANCATRAYSTAPIQFTATLPEIRACLRNVLALPSGEEASQEKAS